MELNYSRSKIFELELDNFLLKILVLELDNSQWMDVIIGARQFSMNKWIWLESYNSNKENG